MNAKRRGVLGLAILVISVSFSIHLAMAGVHDVLLRGIKKVSVAVHVQCEPPITGLEKAIRTEVELLFRDHGLLVTEAKNIPSYSIKISLATPAIRDGVQLRGYVGARDAELNAVVDGVANPYIQLWRSGMAAVGVPETDARRYLAEYVVGDAKTFLNAWLEANPKHGAIRALGD